MGFPHVMDRLQNQPLVQVLPSLSPTPQPSKSPKSSPGEEKNATAPPAGESVVSDSHTQSPSSSIESNPMFEASAPSSFYGTQSNAPPAFEFPQITNAPEALLSPATSIYQNDTSNLYQANAQPGSLYSGQATTSQGLYSNSSQPAPPV